MLIKLKNFRVLIFSLLILATITRAETPPGDKRQCGTLLGYVQDSGTAEPVSGVQVLLTEITRSGMSHEDGHFYIPELPLGKYTLRTFRIGYQNIVVSVNINHCDTNRVVLKITNSPLEIAAIQVTENAESMNLATTPDIVLENKKLRQQLGRTIAETIANEPGLDQRSMGPAPARPVLRGLSGDRLLLLEDGERTGDLSATSADHAVVIEPMTADRIEVIRGPAALIYGSNTLGGVVNVARGYIPTTWLNHIHGTATYQGETVNSGNSGGFAVTGPLGPLSLRLDGSVRHATDIRTPIGRLKNTDILTGNASAGLGLTRAWGNLGMAGSYYQSDYGIPGGFVGAHPNGVDIKLNRRHFETQARFNFPTRWMNQLKLHGTYSRYYHKELESNGILGIEFGVLSYHFSATANLQDFGWLKNGVLGIWTELRDYASGGFTFTPPTKEITGAAFIYEEVHLGKWIFQTALRFDQRLVKPTHESFSKKIGWIRERTFADFSGALSAVYPVHRILAFGGRGMRSFRAPGIEELFSEGPHLAAYAFEVGNPELKEETGIGLEVFARLTGNRGQAEWTVFHNQISDYIFPQNTGQINYRTLLPTYQFTGQDAVLLGSELTAEYEILPHLAVSGMLSYVRGDLTASNTPLPWMPPLSGKLQLKFNRENWGMGASLRSAAPQERLSEFEERTAGYSVLDLNAQVLFSGHLLQSIDVIAGNVTNAEYRRHLSRVKSIVPEPGRNFKLLYRIYF